MAQSPLSSLTSRVVNANHQSVAPSQMESLFAGSRIGDISNCTIQVFQGDPQLMVPSGIWPIHPQFQAHYQNIVGDFSKPVKRGRAVIYDMLPSHLTDRIK